MSEEFDPYCKWLGIPRNEQPPHHYRLLGIGVFEEDPDVIEEAADRQMSHVQTHKTGKHSTLSQKLLNELSAAKLCLLDSEEKNAYDGNLRAQLLTPQSRPPRSETAPAEGAASSITAPPAESPPVVLVSAQADARAVETSRNDSQWMKPAVLASAGVVLAVLIGVGALFWTGGKAPNAAKGSAASADPRPQAKPATTRSPTVAEATPTPPVVRPALAAAPQAASRELSQPIDLLKLIDVERDSLAGHWRLEGPTLVAPVAEFARLQVPYAPPAEYTLEIAVEKPPASHGLIVALPGEAGAQGLLVIDMAGENGAQSFLELRDEPFASNPTLYRARALTDGGSNSILVDVRKSGVRVECNGITIIDWTGDTSRLASQENWNFPNKSQLGVGCWNTEYRISKLELKPLADGPGGAIINGK